MEWHHLDSPTKKKPKAMPSAKKIMGTAFWDGEGYILIEFLLIVSRHYLSFVVYCAINFPEGRSFCSMITLGLTLHV
jgi:hypothetical protein